MASPKSMERAEYERNPSMGGRKDMKKADLRTFNYHQQI